MMKYLRHQEIDKKKWDACLNRYHCKLIYPYTWFLDIAAPGWNALVSGDYESIMPLFVKKKFRMPYISQPHFTQQLGIFGNTKTSINLSELIPLIPKTIKLMDYHFNTGNLILENPEFQLFQNTTFHTDLTPEYNEKYLQYTKSHQKNIRRAERIGLDLSINNDFSAFIQFKKKNKIKKLNVGDSDFNRLLNIILKASEKCDCEVYWAKKNNIPVAAACFITNMGHTIYYSASSDRAKEMKAMFRLIDHYIRNNAGSSQILDFVGSNIGSIASFFEGFGSFPVHYQRISFNRLPSFMTWLRKISS